MNEVINSGLSRYDYKWIKDMNNIIMQSIPLTSDPAFYTLDTISDYPMVSSMMCFQYVVRMIGLVDCSRSLIE